MTLRIVLVLIIASAIAAAQNTSCSLSGSVQDPDGGAFANIEIRLTGADTGFVRTTKTNHEGFFSFPDLTPATFVLSVASPGFKSYSQSGIAITSSEQRSIGIIHLELGSVTDSVSVTAEVAPVMLSSGERANVLTSKDMDEIALKGRDFMGAVALLPGVVDLNEDREAPSFNSMNGIYVLGSRANQKNMTVDGVTNLDTGGNGAVHSMPSMDSVAELKVLMSNYSAEYGRNSGGTVSVITKGGGQKFHGTGGWYHRHEQFNANDYFNNRNGIGRPRYRYNIASYSIGGPVYIPGRFNTDRTKLFFFFSQEFQRQLVSEGTRTVRVPTEMERAGNFSQTYDLNSKLIAVNDPLTNKQPFPGNVIPAARFSQIGQNVLRLFPLPNFVDPDPSRRYQWNFISALSGPYPRRTEIIRTDYSPKQNVQIYARLSNNSDENHPTYSNSWVNGNVNFPLTPIIFREPGRGATVHSTVTLSPSLFNEFVFGVSQNFIRFFPEFPERVSKKATGIDVPAWNPGLNPAGLLPGMTFSGVNNFANPSMNAGLPFYTYNTIFSFVENLSKIYRTHTLKFGIYVERTRKDQTPGSAVRGNLAFGKDTNNPLDSNFAYSNALLGVYNNYSEATAQPQGHYRFTNFEWYAQDNWRVRPGLSLDFGVRLYNDPPQYDALMQLATFVPSQLDPAKAPVLLRSGLDASGKKAAIDPLTGKIYASNLVGTFVPGVGNAAEGMAVGGKNGFPRGLYTMPSVTAAPRLGFAWDPIGNGRTAVRGGVGVFFDRIQGNPTMGMISNPPTVFTPTVYFGTLDGLAATAGKGVLAPSATKSMNGYQPPPTVYNYSFGVQQLVSRNTMLDIAYVGSQSRHFMSQRNINAVPMFARQLDKHPENADPASPATALQANFLRPYQGWADILMREWGASSNYNALQASFSKRLPRGGLVAAGYTFSKALGTASADNDQMSPFFPARSRNYGVLDHNRTHVLTLRINSKLPEAGKYFHKRWLGVITDNWETATIARFMSGTPFTPGFSTTDGQDITGTPSESATIDVVDPNADPVNRFGRPARGTFGNAGNNVLTTPWMNNWDISVYRQIRLGEGDKRIQFRMESYNTFNHTQFSNVTRNARFDPQGIQVDPLFLQPSAARSARRVQLAVRLNW